jgi:hypothetical protein
MQWFFRGSHLRFSFTEPARKIAAILSVVSYTSPDIFETALWIRRPKYRRVQEGARRSFTAGRPRPSLDTGPDGKHKRQNTRPRTRNGCGSSQILPKFSA